MWAVRLCQRQSTADNHGALQLHASVYGRHQKTVSNGEGAGAVAGTSVPDSIGVRGAWGQVPATVYSASSNDPVSPSGSLGSTNCDGSFCELSGGAGAYMGSGVLGSGSGRERIGCTREHSFCYFTGAMRVAQTDAVGVPRQNCLGTGVSESSNCCPG